MTFGHPILVVTGGRAFTDVEFIFRALDRLAVQIYPSLLVHGDAPGVDRICGEWAISRRVSYLPIPADWCVYPSTPKANIRRRSDGSAYNLKAGFERNERMARYPGLTHAAVFPGGRGTADMAERIKHILPAENIFDFRGRYSGLAT